MRDPAPQDRAARVQDHVAAAAARGVATPVRTFAPVKRATNASAGVVQELGGRALLHERAPPDDAEAVGERGGIADVVRHEQRGQPQLGEQVLQLAAHPCARVGVQRAERLVEQQDVGIAREAPCERDALALAARDRAGPRAREVGDPERSSSSPARAAPPNATLARTLRCGKSA
jgi:hypothetical protein